MNPFNKYCSENFALRRFFFFSDLGEPGGNPKFFFWYSSKNHPGHKVDVCRRLKKLYAGIQVPNNSIIRNEIELY